MIFPKKLKDHVESVKEVVTLLYKAVASLKIYNFQLSLKSLDYIVHVLLLGRIGIDLESTFTIADSTYPPYMTQLRFFLR